MVQYARIDGVPSCDLHHLLKSPADVDPDTGIRYHGVYPTGRGTFVAKAFKRRVSPVCGTETAAARHVAGWWGWAYGPAWPGLFRGRHNHAWVITRDGDRYRILVVVARTFGLPQLHRPGLYYLRVYPGHPRGLFFSPARPVEAVAGPRSRNASFGSPAECRAALRMWEEDVFASQGFHPGHYLRRHVDPVPARGGY